MFLHGHLLSSTSLDRPFLCNPTFCWQAISPPLMASAAPFPFLRLSAMENAKLVSDENEPAQTKCEMAHARGRKTTKGVTRKKQPQRGMGVAQLEWLRMQERWKKVTEEREEESACLQSLSAAPCLSSGTVSSRYGRPVSHGVPMFSSVPFSGLGHGGEAVKITENRTNAFGFGLGGSRMLGNPSESRARDAIVACSTSSVSSFIHQYESSFYDLLVKKKKFEGENLGFHQWRNKFAENPLTAEFEFLGPNAEMSGFRCRDARGYSYASRNLTEGEVGMFQTAGETLKGNSVMEYDFFSEESAKCTGFMEPEFSLVAGDEVSNVTSDYSRVSASAASNSVDLSLKLSL